MTPERELPLGCSESERPTTLAVGQARISVETDEHGRLLAMLSHFDGHRCSADDLRVLRAMLTRAIIALDRAHLEWLETPTARVENEENQ